MNFKLHVYVLCSSCFANFYLNVQVHPQVEEYWGHVNPIGPRACYDEGKRVAETMAYAYANQVCDIHVVLYYRYILYV